MKILVGSWFALPRLSREAFAALMKEGVVYDKALGFKLDAATDMESAIATIRAATGEEVMLSVRCFVCVRGGTVILGDNKRIRDLRPKDQSVGISGLCKIKRTFSRRYEGNILRIKAAGMLPIETTPEHPILVTRSRTTRRGKGRLHPQSIAFESTHWKEAGEIVPKRDADEGDYVLIPRVPGRIDEDTLDLRQFTGPMGERRRIGKNVPLQIPLSTETSWLLGIYVARGFRSSTGACFPFGHDETRLHEKLVEIGKALGYAPSTIRSRTLAIIPSRRLLRALSEWCGRDAEHKKIPDFVLFHKDLNVLKAFLDGYSGGEGRYSGNLLSMSTTSRILALQIQLLGARLGSFIAVSRSRRGQAIIEDRSAASGQKYELRRRPRSKQSYARVTERGIITPVRRIESVPFGGNVYNIETEDNTYLVCNAVVHNCGAEACPGCPYGETCDRAKVSPLCLCEKHAPELNVYGLYEKTFADSIS